MQSYLGTHRIKWYFIFPHAPWQGGMYGRMMGIVKSSLHKDLHHKTVSAPELVTIIAEIEVVVNNRPLVYLDDSVKSTEDLTAAHLLYGRRVFLFPSFESHDYQFDQVNNIETIHNYNNKVSAIIKRFKKIWSIDYLQSLREKHYSSRSGPNETPKIGELVIVGLEQDKSKWTLGKVVDLVKGSDKKIREVLINCQNRLQKTVEKLILLELSQDDSEPQKHSLSDDMEGNS